MAAEQAGVLAAAEEDVGEQPPARGRPEHNRRGEHEADGAGGEGGLPAVQVGVVPRVQADEAADEVEADDERHHAQTVEAVAQRLAVLVADIAGDPATRDGGSGWSTRISA